MWQHLEQNYSKIKLLSNKFIHDYFPNNCKSSHWQILRPQFLEQKYSKKNLWPENSDLTTCQITAHSPGVILRQNVLEHKYSKMKPLTRKFIHAYFPNDCNLSWANSQKKKFGGEQSQEKNLWPCLFSKKNCQISWAKSQARMFGTELLKEKTSYQKIYTWLLFQIMAKHSWGNSQAKILEQHCSKNTFVNRKFIHGYLQIIWGKLASQELCGRLCMQMSCVYL